MKNETLNDMVFKNKNKLYGAYSLRVNYSNYLRKALLIGCSLAILVFSSAWGYNKYYAPKPDELKRTSITLNPDLPPVEEPEEVIIPEIPPVIEEVPPPIRTLAFLPPEPIADEEVIIEMPPPTIEELEGSAIGKEDIEGEETTAIFSPPPSLVPPTVTVVDLDKPDEQKEFIAVEQMPEFPGGNKEMNAYLGKSINYPRTAQTQNVTGKVFVKFLVDIDGAISKVEVLKGIGFGCDEEAIRVIKKMPNWSPGKQNGKKVKVWFTVPINFQLN